jgi:hypothetical protein
MAVVHMYVSYGHKTNQNLPVQDPPKFTQIGIFDLKIYHLATLSVTTQWFVLIGNRLNGF